MGRGCRQWPHGLAPLRQTELLNIQRSGSGSALAGQLRYERQIASSAGWEEHSTQVKASLCSAHCNKVVWLIMNLMITLQYHSFSLCLGNTLNIVLIVIYRCTYVIYFTYTYYTVKYKNTSLLKAYNLKMASLKIYPNNIKHFIKVLDFEIISRAIYQCFLEWTIYNETEWP